MIGGSLAVLLASYFSDPNGGALTLTWLLQLTTPIVAVWFAYLSRHALFDYLDMEELLEKAKESAIGSAIAFAGICIVIFGLLGLFGASAKAQEVSKYVPVKAHVYLPTVASEQYRLWPTHPKGT